MAKLLLNRQAPQRRRGWRAKVHEAVLALRLEHRLQKREILALYLNLAAYGNQTAGFERASQTYFGVESRMLTAAQAAFLAGLPQRPTTFNPYRNQAAATSRQRYVLGQMKAAGVLTAAEVDEARERTAGVRSRAPALPCAALRRDGAGSDAGPQRPSRIETTLDARLQDDITGIIRTQRASLDRHGAANVAVVVLDNERGEWLAWEGSGDYFDAEHGGAINGPLMLRQPGSALKPLTYALAFEKGFTPASVLPDVPMHFPTAEPGVVYSPRNYDGRYRGPLLARAALAGSENVPAVALASELGVPDLLRFLNRAGFSTFDRTAAHYGLGLTLGNAEVRLDELVTAYAALARGGEWQRSTYLGGANRRAAHAGDAAHGVLARRHPLGRRGARLHLRPRRQPRAAVPGSGQDRNVAGVPRQLDDWLHAAADRGRLGRQLRPPAAAQLERRHRCGADLSGGHARGAQAARARRGSPARSRSVARRAAHLRVVRRAREQLVSGEQARMAAGIE